MASQSLRGRGLEEFLPLWHLQRRWTDRVKVVSRPLLPGYVFCRFTPNQLSFVLDGAGCVQAVKCGTQLAPVPDEDIQALKRLVASEIASPYPYLREGTRVRIRAGAFENLEGYVQRIKNQDQRISYLYS